MEEKKSKIGALLRMSIGLPASESSCCGGPGEGDTTPTDHSESTAAVKSGADCSDDQPCCGAKQAR